MLARLGSNRVVESSAATLVALALVVGLTSCSYIPFWGDDDEEVASAAYPDDIRREFVGLENEDTSAILYPDGAPPSDSPVTLQPRHAIEHGESSQIRSGPEAVTYSPRLPEPVKPERPLSRGTMGVKQLCQRIGAKLGSVSTRDCDGLGMRASVRSSVEGHTLAWKDYPPLAGREPLGRVLLLGGIHGDELSAVSIVFKWMEKLEKYHSGLFHWRVAPLVNPDGLLRADHQRMNGNGVDLNRNFPTLDWETEAPAYWAKRRHAPRRYPGPAAGSEPETRWLVDEIGQFRPDVIVQVHAPYGIIDYDGPNEPPGKLGRLRLYLLGVYPGSLGNYGGVVQGIPVVTIELPEAGTLPDSGEISRMWGDLVGWLRNHLKQVRVAEAKQ